MRKNRIICMRFLNSIKVRKTLRMTLRITARAQFEIHNYNTFITAPRDDKCFNHVLAAHRPQLKLHAHVHVYMYIYMPNPI